MTVGDKVIWNDMVVTVIGEEHKSSFGDLLRIKIDCSGELKIVNSQYLKKFKYL